LEGHNPGMSKNLDSYKELECAPVTCKLLVTVGEVEVKL
jgi:hypothetical protein